MNKCNQQKSQVQSQTEFLPASWLKLLEKTGAIFAFFYFHYFSKLGFLWILYKEKYTRSKSLP